MIGLTAAIAAYAAGSSGPPPDDLLPLIRAAFTNTLGTMLAGRHEPVVPLLRAHLAERGATAAEASVLLSGERTHAADAALVNGTGAQALDDDVALAGHRIRRIAVPNAFSGGMREDTLPAPRLGADTEAVLRGIGFDEERIATMMASGAAFRRAA